MTSLENRPTVNVPPELKAFSGPRRDRNIYLASLKDVNDSECCAICGKPAKGGKFVYLTDDGCYTTAEEGQEHDALVVADGGSPDDLGLYPVGADCARKLKSAGVTLYPWGCRP